MNFTLKQLRYVEATGRLGSIASAALEANISQSSITAAIAALEGQLGFDLFVRTPAKGIRVTPAGQETLRLIRAFLIKCRHFEAEIMAVGGNAAGAVRVACYATAAPAFLPPVLKNFKALHPDTSITLLEGNMETTMAYLASGDADLVFTYDTMAEHGYDFTPLFKAPPYALLPADDPLAKGGDVSLHELTARPMVMLDLPHTKAYFNSLFEAFGIQPNVVHSTRSAEIVRALVGAGHGYSILNISPPDYRENDTRFRVLPLRDKLHAPTFGIVTMTGLGQPKIVQEFISNCVSLKHKGVFDEIIVS